MELEEMTCSISKMVLELRFDDVKDVTCIKGIEIVASMKGLKIKTKKQTCRVNQEKR